MGDATTTLTDAAPYRQNFRGSLGHPRKETNNYESPPSAHAGRQPMLLILESIPRQGSRSVSDIRRQADFDVLKASIHAVDRFFMLIRVSKYFEPVDLSLTH